MTTAALQTVLTVPERFRGPAAVANGGWIAGTMADALNGHRSAVEVTLHAPTPLDTEVRLEHVANTVTLTDGDKLLVEAFPVAEDLEAPDFVPFTDAARAEAGFPGWHGHAFPECFVCGLREPGDGLRIFPGPVEGTGLVAAGWRVPFTVADEDGVPASIVGAALDCVTGWAHFAPGESALLGRLAVQIHRRVYPGGTYSVVGEATGRDGRKLFGRSAIYENDGALVASARATWIAPR
ncbi:PaaI family thioesterase [Nonomuraea sediminis]|uniref:PaaI family thioesterase n=1 Tax=Nonomuraea sediminis TaxID=2835864 RepID=UPI001BDD519E|nr:hotdog fold domain-containing protein [Nonomuraea sediminis]